MKAYIFLAAACAAPAFAQDVPRITTLGYACDRGVSVPATHVVSEGGSVAVIGVEGRQITLMQEVSASGARYGWPSDGASYVWWTKGDEATLFWRDGEVETVLLNCAAKDQTTGQDGAAGQD